jgi:hypothetical protein
MYGRKQFEPSGMQHALPGPHSAPASHVNGGSHDVDQQKPSFGLGTQMSAPEQHGVRLQKAPCVQHVHRGVQPNPSGQAPLRASPSHCSLA